jgi:hypothetical protein
MLADQAGREALRDLAPIVTSDTLLRRDQSAGGAQVDVSERSVRLHQSPAIALLDRVGVVRTAMSVRQSGSEGGYE